MYSKVRTSSSRLNSLRHVSQSSNLSSLLACAQTSNLGPKHTSSARGRHRTCVPAETEAEDLALAVISGKRAPGGRAYQCQGVQSLLVARSLQHHAQLEDLGVLLGRGVPEVAAVLVGIVVVFGIQLQVRVFGSHSEQQSDGSRGRVRELWWDIW